MKPGQVLSNSDISKKYLSAIGLIVLTLAMVAPAIHIHPAFPNIRPEEILLLFSFPLLFNFSGITKDVKLYLWLTLAFVLFILFEIGYQNRSGIIRDYFEALKILKYAWFFLISYFFFTLDKLKNVLKYIFVFLVSFNIAHYFNLFDFNLIIEPIYAPDVHLKFFGLNTLGQPDTKRLLGTLGNPNNNAILFLFFMCLFSFSKERSIRVLFYIAFVFMLACQSRTALIASLPVLFLRWSTMKNYKLISKDILVLLASAIAFFYLDAAYLAALGDTGKLMEGGSVKGRLQVWSELWVMIKQNPWLGHGPNKDYFYDRNMYPESEYMLALWRYGWLGFILFLIWLSYPVINYFKSKYLNPELLFGISFWMVILISCITNNPLQEPSILLMFACSTGLLFKAHFDRKPYEKVIAGR